MSTQSHIVGHSEKPNLEDLSLNEIEIENSPAVEINPEDVDLSKLDPSVKFIRFWRG